MDGNQTRSFIPSRGTKEEYTDPGHGSSSSIQTTGYILTEDLENYSIDRKMMNEL